MVAYRADVSYPLTLTGETSPLAALNFYRNSMSTVLHTHGADSVGNFNFWSSPLTAALAEGENTIYAQATKDTYYSPYAERKVILDLKPPEIADPAPSGTVADLFPYVGATLTDSALSAGSPSGICAEVTTMKINGSTVNFVYDEATGNTQWVDPATDLPVLLTNGASYTAVLEGGDRAYYKAASTWTFTVSVAGTDHSAPSIANKVPSGSTSESLPEISCKVFDNQSGIILSSIVLKVDGAVVVSSANISGHWNAKEQRVFYQPPGAFENYSSHTAEVTASHWASDPLDKKTSVESWNFNVSY